MSPMYVKFLRLFELDVHAGDSLEDCVRCRGRGRECLV